MGLNMYKFLYDSIKAHNVEMGREVEGQTDGEYTVKWRKALNASMKILSVESDEKRGFAGKSLRGWNGDEAVYIPYMRLAVKTAHKPEAEGEYNGAIYSVYLCANGEVIVCYDGGFWVWDMSEVTVLYPCRK